MTRLQKLLRAGYHERPTVARLKSEIPELRELADVTVQELWGDWSDDAYCATWLVCNEGHIEKFRAYLLADCDAGVSE